MWADANNRRLCIRVVVPCPAVQGGRPLCRPRLEWKERERRESTTGKEMQQERTETETSCSGRQQAARSLCIVQIDDRRPSLHRLIAHSGIYATISVRRFAEELKASTIKVCDGKAFNNKTTVQLQGVEVKAKNPLARRRNHSTAQQQNGD